MIARLLALVGLLMALAGASPAVAQTAAVLNPPVTVGQCPGWSDVYGTLVNSGIGCANNQLTISDGSHGSILISPTTYLSAGSPSILNTTSGQPLIFQKGVATTATDAADFKCERSTTYTGGTPGFVNACLYVHANVQPGGTSYEWPFLTRLDNYATASPYSENVAGYCQGRKYSTGATWGCVTELYDYTGDPSTSSSVHEFDIRMTGTDNTGGGGRVGLDLFGTSNDGNPAVARHGYRINTDANSTFTNVFETNGTFVNGFNLTGGTFSGPAIALAAGQKLTFDGLTATTYLSQSGGTLNYHNAAGNSLQVDSSGNLTAFATISAFGGDVQIASGKHYCLNAATCSYNLALSGSNIQVNTPSGTAAQFTGLTSNLLATTATSIDSTGRSTVASGQKFCLDATTCAYDFLLSGGNTIQVNTASGTAAQFTGLTTNLLGMTATTMDASTRVTVPTNNKFCFDGTTCNAYVAFDGTNINFYIGGSLKGQLTSTGYMSTTNGYYAGGSQGQNCLATGYHQTFGGIVVVC